MSDQHNPFPTADPDRYALWEMLVARDIEAFIRQDWNLIASDFVDSGFTPIDARNSDNPDSWRLTYAKLDDYRRDWLEQARQLSVRCSPQPLRQALYEATTLRDIEVKGDAAILHKKFDGEVVTDDGERIRLKWQTIYQCVKAGSQWKIAGFVGYLPNPMGSGSPPALAARRLPPGATQHQSAGPYSPVLIVQPGALVVISGQAAIAPDGSMAGDTLEDQTHATLENCRKQLAAAGCSLSDVFKVTVYLTDLANWSAFNAIYRDYLPEPRPVRTAVQIGLLPGLLVEVEMWAVKA